MDKPTGSQGAGEKYADPGYQEDKQPRYPVTKDGKLDAERVRAAWSYIHQADNRDRYSAEQLSNIEGEIRAAAKEVGVELEDGEKKADPGLWIFTGSEVKALGNGKIGGYLVTFGGTGDRSPKRDIFEPDTDYHTDFPAPLGVYFFHGSTKAYGKRRLGSGTCTKDAQGIHIEAEVKDAEIYAQAERGELAWSSGAVAHLVERDPLPTGAHKVLSWPMGEASVAPAWAVADARNTAVAIKTITTDDPDGLLERARSRPDARRSLAEETERWLEDGEEMLARYRLLHASETKVGRVLSASRMERLQRAHALIGEILTEACPPETETVGEDPSGAETEPAMEGKGWDLERALMRARTTLLLQGAS